MGSQDNRCIKLLSMIQDYNLEDVFLISNI